MKIRIIFDGGIFCGEQWTPIPPNSGGKSYTGESGTPAGLRHISIELFLVSDFVFSKMPYEHA